MTRKRAPSERKTPREIPVFSSYEEEARFWDTHDITDFVDEFNVSDGPNGPVLWAHVKLGKRAKAKATKSA